MRVDRGEGASMGDVPQTAFRSKRYLPCSRFVNLAISRSRNVANVGKRNEIVACVAWSIVLGKPCVGTIGSAGRMVPTAVAYTYQSRVRKYECWLGGGRGAASSGS